MKMLEDQEVVEKQTATFTCTLSKPRLKVTWYRGDVKINEDGRIQFVQEGKVYKLIITNAKLEDMGEYKIKFGDEAESRADLTVRELPIKLKSLLEDQRAIEEDASAVFTIEASKKISPGDDFRWTMNGRRIDTDDLMKYSMQTEGKMCRLIIKKIRLEDEGAYAVEINGSRSSANLFVDELPVKFIKPIIDQTGVEDQSVTFECEISKAQWKKTGHDVVVKWYRGEREIRDSSKYNIKRNGVQHSLIIKEINFDDASEYSAVVGLEKTKANLVINEAEANFVNKLKDCEVTEKETAQLDCELTKIHSTTSSEPYQVTWYKKTSDGEVKITPSNKFETLIKNKRVILKIHDSTPDDAGVYTVVVGNLKSSAKVTVNEIPVVIKKPLEDQRGKEGQSCTFECTVNRADKPIKWFVNGQLVTKEQIKSGKYSVLQEKNKLQLTVNNLDLIDDNNCEITCQVGDKAKTSAKLKVDEDDIKFIERLADVGVKEGDRTILTCKLNKLKYESRPNQELKIKWFMKGKEVNEKFLTENERMKLEQDGTTLRMNISSVIGDDAGDVKCMVNGDIFTAGQLSVEEEPVMFIKKLTDITCSEVPGKVCFECLLNKSFVNAKWYKNGEEIDFSNAKYDFGREGPKHFLYIKDVDGKDEAEYTIVLQGKSQKKCMAELSVKAAPKMFLNAKFKDTVTIKRGTPLELEIGFSAYPLPKYSWSFNDEKFKETPRSKTEMLKNNLVTLTLNKTTRSDSGKYNLTLENECGRETCTVKVNVLDKPGPPRDPQVVDVSGKISNQKIP